MLPVTFLHETESDFRIGDGRNQEILLIKDSADCLLKSMNTYQTAPCVHEVAVKAINRNCSTHRLATKIDVCGRKKKKESWRKCFRAPWRCTVLFFFGSVWRNKSWTLRQQILCTQFSLTVLNVPSGVLSSLMCVLVQTKSPSVRNKKNN